MAGYVLLPVATSTSGLLTEGEPSFKMISEKRRFTGHYIVLRTSNFEGSARHQLWLSTGSTAIYRPVTDNTNETTDSQVRARRKNRITATLTLREVYKMKAVMTSHSLIHYYCVCQWEERENIADQWLEKTAGKDRWKRQLTGRVGELTNS